MSDMLKISKDSTIFGFRCQRDYVTGSIRGVYIEENLSVTTIRD